MSQRITEKLLSARVELLNQLAGENPEPYTNDPETNRYRANVGTYALDYAYGGVKLVRMTNPGGGQTNISTAGYATKRETFEIIASICEYLFNQGVKI